MHFIDSRKSGRQKLLTQTQLNQIDKRRLYAIKANDIEDIENAKTKVLKIINDDGLNSQNEQVRLKTALQILPFIVPAKKQSEIIHNNKKIEDLIKQYTLKNAEDVEYSETQKEEEPNENILEHRTPASNT
jgi:hypothetical protein